MTAARAPDVVIVPAVQVTGVASVWVLGCPRGEAEKEGEFLWTVIMQSEARQ